jgi:hypothetical protein
LIAIATDVTINQQVANSQLLERIGTPLCQLIPFLQVADAKKIAYHSKVLLDGYACRSKMSVTFILIIGDWYSSKCTVIRGYARKAKIVRSISKCRE